MSDRSAGSTPVTDPQGRASDAARTSYGRLLAVLASSTGDIAGAEDALADAFERALTRWPVDGVPRNPDGWLLTVARNRLRDGWKSAATSTSVPLEPQSHERGLLDDVDPDAIGDRRLELLLVCAHPDIDPAVHTPLMLDVVLGFTAKQIAAAFDVPAPTVAARLGRAKKRIRESRIPFEIPDRTQLPARIDAVLNAIYGAYAIDWPTAGTQVRDGLAEESLYLADTVAAMMPDDAEAHGLAALIGLSTARLRARFDGDGRLIPLAEQDTARWNTTLIERADDHLRRAHALRTLGRFQLEAAIQSVHCARRFTSTTDWHTLRALHETLQTLAPTNGGAVSLAAVVAEIDGAGAGLAVLDTLNAPRFQPAWATRAHLLAKQGAFDEAVVAYDKAISLTTDIPSRRYLEDKRNALATSVGDERDPEHSRR
ncbi:DNA-directed RNA polymerase sigma-70 factor [Rhodococcoides trifolii]|uniref:DNA-directed RNA polymerase sigma-70 factor n=1 Tax=Rhodococcoides trifolii TaxID=908250 RepID=A0A917CKX1_9NOCA|nr:DUF6596 domain-containing protein [Rhodococcus trifolii]GGF90905.1 DNA-directed RNA polymerase sigma-70 factor [Rhodococcus trifolii]